MPKLRTTAMQSIELDRCILLHLHIRDLCTGVFVGVARTLPGHSTTYNFQLSLHSRNIFASAQGRAAPFATRSNHYAQLKKWKHTRKTFVTQIQKMKAIVNPRNHPVFISYVKQYKSQIRNTKYLSTQHHSDLFHSSLNIKEQADNSE